MAVYLVLTNVSRRLWQAVIDENRKVIGRHSDSEIATPPERLSVSRRHAEAWTNRQSVYMKDLGSSAGTTVNDVRLKPFRDYEIHVGDRIALGDRQLEVVGILADDENVLVGGEAEDQHGPDSTLKITALQSTADVNPEALLQLLTHAEREVVLWMARGVTYPKDIARLLYRSPNTIRTQLNSIFSKLGVHSRDELLGWLKRAHLPNDAFRTGSDDPA